MNDNLEAANRYRAPALIKGLDIIELLARSPSMLSLTAIGSMLGRTMGEIYRIVQALESRGYIRRDADTDQYGLTLRLFELAHAHPPIEQLTRVAQPIMDRLAGRVEQSCHLAVQNGAHVLIVATSESHSAMHYSVRLGARFRLAETSSGAVLFAYLSDLQREAIMADVLADTPELAGDLPERAMIVHRTGGERRRSFVVSGVTNLSWPIFDHRRSVVAALTVPYLEQIGLDVSVDDAERALACAAQDISSALGWRGNLTTASDEGESA